jgi:UDP-N-acetylglucosamine--N-acetylmuramyl-(pentapeptide) pyrophosphoryl-undecaprenol N-acetylglucosamine transferase
MIDSDAQDSAEGLASEERTNEISPTKMKQKKQQLRQNQLIRENRRLRNSASFRVGKLFTRAATKPWLLPLLPFSILFLVFSIGMERLGRWPVPVDSKGMRATSLGKPRDCVMFFPTNGVGFGHFTRMYALAKRFKKYSPSTEIVFFTTMPTLHLLYNEGFVTYHIAGRKKYHDVSASEWNALVEEHLSLAFDQHKPSTFIFDGAFPYRGMLNAIRGQAATRKIWMRRGTFKKGSRIPVDSIAHFDTIIHPEDSVPLAPNELEHGVESITCAPIVLLDESDLLPRKAARRRLNLPLKGRVVYVQLGAGRINDIGSEIRLTVEALLRYDGVTVVIGESMLGERIDINLNRVVLLRDYPNSMYFNAFDATVQAGGYNSFHETRKFGLPALFYPNMNTGMDDQLARCKVAETEGWGKVIVNRTPSAISDGIKHLLSMNRKSSNNTPIGALEVYQKIQMSSDEIPGWARLENSNLVHRINQRFIEINGYEMDWMKPITFNHYIQRLKFNLDQQIVNLTDKLLVRDYVAARVGSEFLIPLRGVYEGAEEIDFDSTATGIVIKTNHGSGPNHCEMFPSQKTNDEIREKFTTALSNPYYGTKWGEFQYDGIEPKLLVEERIGLRSKPPEDYKFHMWDAGQNNRWFLQVNIDRGSAQKLNVYDQNFHLMDVQKSGLPNADFALPERDHLDSMFQIAKKLADGHPYVRVDLYLVDDKVYFGELTFTPGCGFGEFSDMSIAKQFGSYFEEVGF